MTPPATARFAGQVALVTGAAQGIGAATARGFVAGGGQVVLAHWARIMAINLTGAVPWLPRRHSGAGCQQRG